MKHFRPISERLELTVMAVVANCLYSLADARSHMPSRHDTMIAKSQNRKIIATDPYLLSEFDASKYPKGL